jgi:ring-1,2-phenylacetyl-CoA epoxidase subunit PaaD
MVGLTASARGRAVYAERAREIAEQVPDPELPMLTLADLGVLRTVDVDDDGVVTVVLTPTYSGCPAMAEMRAEVDRRLHEAGYGDVAIRTQLRPAWTTDWITPAGRKALAENGIAPPRPASPGPAAGPVPVLLSTTRPALTCPKCGSTDTEQLSRFAATSCRALWRCRACREPFEYFKDL